MRPGNFGLPKERLKRFDSGLVTIDSTNGNTFFHGFGQLPASVEVRLVCMVAANGYVPGEEMPLAALVRNTGGDRDGGPRSVLRVTDQRVSVLIPSSSIEIIDSTGSAAAVTLSNYRLRVTCLDVFPIG